MFRTVLLISLMLICSTASLPQSVKEEAASYAGCYQVVSLTWSPPDPNAKYLEQHLIFNDELADDGWLTIGTTDRKLRPNERWYWKVTGKNKIKVIFGWGLGGYEGSLSRKDISRLVGKIKNYCDFKCSSTEVGTIELQKMDCKSANLTSYFDTSEGKSSALHSKNDASYMRTLYPRYFATK